MYGALSCLWWFSKQIFACSVPGLGISMATAAWLMPRQSGLCSSIEVLALFVGRSVIKKPIKVLDPGVVVLLALGDEEQFDPAVYFLSAEPVNHDSTILPAVYVDVDA